MCDRYNLYTLYKKSSLIESGIWIYKDILFIY